MCGASDNGDGAVDRTVTSTTETMPSRVGRETSIVLARIYDMGEGFMGGRVHDDGGGHGYPRVEVYK